MKNIIFFSIKIVVFILTLHSCFGQQTPDLQEIKAGKPYRAWLFSKTDRLRLIGGGEFYRLSEDSVTLVKPYKTSMQINSYAVQNIDRIGLRRKGNIGKGIIIGAVTGLLAGIATGYAWGDGPVGLVELKAGEKAALCGVFMAEAGGFIGAAIGAKKIRIPIDRQKDKYLRVKDKLDTIRYAPQNK